MSWAEARDKLTIKPDAQDDSWGWGSNGEIFARLVVSKPQHEERCHAMGIKDTKRVYRARDLASGETIIFAAAGVTDGTLLKGVRFFGDGIRTSSLIMQTHPHRVRFIDSIHVDPRPDVKVRF